MILRFKLFTLAGAAALMGGGVDAFAPVRPSSAISRSARRVQSSSALRLGALDPDWKNDDFLSSLDKGPEQIDAANDKYFKQAESRAAVNEWRAQQMQQQQQPQSSAPEPPAAGDGKETTANGPSPEFFKKMGLNDDLAQQVQQQVQQGLPPQLGQPQQPPQQQMMQQQMQPPQQMQQPPQQQMQQPPPQYGQPQQMQQPMQMQPPQQQMQQFYDANGNPVNMPMVYDANGNLVPFNNNAPQQQMQQQQPQQMIPQQQVNAQGIYEPPLPPRTKGTDIPRPEGFNADSYAISNTADVYFAQLKQDSKVRKAARMSGDTDTANRVFADDTVRQIGDSWNENPYTKEKNRAEAGAEIEGIVRMHVIDDDVPQSLSGASYKDKLAQMKAKRAGGGGAVAAAAPPRAELPPPVVVAAPAPPQGEQPRAAVTAPPKVEQPKVGMPAPAHITQPKSSVQAPPPQMIPTTAVPPPPVAELAASSGATDEGDVRTKVRTLQGLLLKHRGGPGFGAGRLRAPEATRLESALGDVKDILRSEVGGTATVTNPAPTIPVPEPVRVVQSIQPAVAQQQQQAVAPPRAMPASPTAAKAATMVSSAVTDPVPDRLAGSVACVEAALKMYKESSPDDRESMLMPLREALMAAASASNRYIAERDIEAHRAKMQAGPSAAAATAASASMGSAPPAAAQKPMMGFPTTYEVTKPDEEERAAPSAQSAPPAVADRSENDKKLEEVYNALVNAKGDGGKLGLKNISGAEANALAEKLQTMRTVLLDELNSGS